jgi:hypothetical protein
VSMAAAASRRGNEQASGEIQNTRQNSVFEIALEYDTFQLICRLGRALGAIYEDSISPRYYRE